MTYDTPGAPKPELGVIDVEPQALSAVDLAFEPEEDRRWLGVYNVLWLIGEIRRRGAAAPLPWLLRARVARDELQGFL